METRCPAQGQNSNPFVLCLLATFYTLHRDSKSALIVLCLLPKDTGVLFEYLKHSARCYVST